MKHGRLAALAAAICLTSLPAADAATIDGEGAFFSADASYVGEGDEVNIATLTWNPAAGGAVQVVEQGPGVVITPLSPGCGKTSNPERGFCTPKGSDSSVEVLLGGGNDQLYAEQAPFDLFVAGAAGNDLISLGNGDDFVTGMSGDDTVNGGGGADLITDQGLPSIFIPVGGDLGGGNDTWDAGPGTDMLDGGSDPSPTNTGPGGGRDVMRGGAGIDTLNYTQRQKPVNVTVDGGPGVGDDDGGAGEKDDVEGVEVLQLGMANDTAVGGSTADTVEGRGGEDTLNGGGGNDKLYGAAPNDTTDVSDDLLDGGPGADEMHGGRGNDTASYATRTAGVTLALDENANDGEPGEGDFIDFDVERAVGGLGNDNLTGSNDPDTLEGGPGNDVIDGVLGDDVLAGDAGDDTVNGNVGNDSVTGGEGNDGLAGGDNDDTVSGGDGNDSLAGDAGADTLAGGIGNDAINGGSGPDAVDAGDGDDAIDVRDNERDTVTCGAGTDTVLADSADVLAADCETASVVQVPGGGTGGTGGTGGGGGGTGGTAVRPLQPDFVSARLVRRTVRVIIACPATAPFPCAGRLRLSAGTRPRRVGELGFALAPGRRRTLVFSVPRALRRTLRPGRGAIRGVMRLDTSAGAASMRIRITRPRR